MKVAYYYCKKSSFLRKGDDDFENVRSYVDSYRTVESCMQGYKERHLTSLQSLTNL